MSKTIAFSCKTTKNAAPNKKGVLLVQKEMA